MFPKVRFLITICIFCSLFNVADAQNSNSEFKSTIAQQRNLVGQVSVELNSKWVSLSIAEKSVAYLKRFTPFLSWMDLCGAVDTATAAFLPGSCVEEETRHLLGEPFRQFEAKYSDAISRLWHQNPLDAFSFSTGMFGLSSSYIFEWNAGSLLQILAVPFLLLFFASRFGLVKVFLATTAIWLLGGAVTSLVNESGDLVTLTNLHSIFVDGFGSIAIAMGLILLGHWVWINKIALSSRARNLVNIGAFSSSKKRLASAEGDGQFANEARWDALLRFDPDISAAAEGLRPYGIKWIDEFRRSYFALNEDRSYVPTIAKKLLDEAKQEEVRAMPARFGNLYDGKACSEESIEILSEAERFGYSIGMEQSGTISASKDGGTSYFRSNSEIKRFGASLRRREQS